MPSLGDSYLASFAWCHQRGPQNARHAPRGARGRTIRVPRAGSYLLPPLAALAFAAVFLAAPVLAQTAEPTPTDPEFWSNLLGVGGATAAVIVVLYRIMAMIPKLIPDSATGILGGIRKIFRILTGTVKDNPGTNGGGS